MTTTNTRIVAPQTTIGSRPSQTAPEPEAAQPTKKGGNKGKWVRMIGVLIVVAAVGGYWFLMGPGAGTADDAAAAPAGPVEYELGEVLVVEPISINLEGGHYLRLGLGLQLTADAGTHGPAINSAKALDAAIALFSGRTMEELADGANRETLKRQLTSTLKTLYDDQVVGVYYTDFVTQ